MREIKFRAWDKKNKRMAEVWSIHWKAWDSDGGINFVKVCYGDGTYELFEHHEVELIQSIGCKDKNGVEIFAGDIVAVADGYADGRSIHAIKWMGKWDYPAFDLSPRLDCESNGIAYAICEADWSIEVIGNILNNPELLEPGKGE